MWEHLLLPVFSLPPKDAHAVIPGAWMSQIPWQGRSQVADGIEMAHYLTLNPYPGLCRWAQLTVDEGGGQRRNQRVRELWLWKKGGRDAMLPAMKVEEEMAMRQGMWEPPGVGKGKDPPLEPPEGMQPCQHFDFTSWDQCWISDLQNWKIIICIV